MRIVVQRVSSAKVEVDGKTAGEIGPGLLILLGIRQDDSRNEAGWLAEKCTGLRIFEDQAGKMNRSVKDLGGEILVVSQFTLYGNSEKGRRPSFVEAAPPGHSRPIYDFFVERLRQISGLRVEQGIFGASMQVSLVNHGPVTLIIEKNRDLRITGN